jgi:hypothetical protein
MWRMGLLTGRTTYGPRVTVFVIAIAADLARSAGPS